MTSGYNRVHIALLRQSFITHCSASRRLSAYRRGMFRRNRYSKYRAVTMTSIAEVLSSGPSESIPTGRDSQSPSAAIPATDSSTNQDLCSIASDSPALSSSKTSGARGQQGSVVNEELDHNDPDFFISYRDEYMALLHKKSPSTCPRFPLQAERLAWSKSFREFNTRVEELETAKKEKEEIARRKAKKKEQQEISASSSAQPGS